MINTVAWSYSIDSKKNNAVASKLIWPNFTAQITIILAVKTISKKHSTFHGIDRLIVDSSDDGKFWKPINVVHGCRNCGSRADSALWLASLSSLLGLDTCIESSF